MPLNEQAGLKKFLQLCKNVKSDSQLMDLFIFFLTHEELASLGARINLTAELLKGDLTQREIAAELNISIAKITRGSNMLKRTDPALKEQIKNLLLKDS